MEVKAAPGTQCPMEGDPRKLITDAVAVDVPNTSYYRRLLLDGSLVPAKKTPANKPVKGGQSNE
ncbi:MAG: DUF2635 domain-containing protein [Deltaproteobacteria bacterium]|nr:DUF2635 domain-containing protein [Deltaproteobacteria bacterium]